MATASEDLSSDTESCSDSDEEQEVFSNLSQFELFETLNDAIKLYTKKSKE
jgi:hypothetical protein